MKGLDVDVSEERDRKFRETAHLRWEMQRSQIAGVTFLALGILGRVTVTPDTLVAFMDDNVHKNDPVLDQIEAAFREAASILSSAN